MRNLVWLMIVMASACGGGVSSPSSAQPIQVAGTWRGSLRVVSGTGEPCVGAAFQSAAGVSFDYALRIEQSADVLTGITTSPATGIECRLTGMAGTSSIVLNLTTCSNISPPRFFSCAPDVFRDARPSALAVNASIGGNSLSGTYSEAYDVFVSGTTSNVGTATLNAQLTLSK